MLDPTTTLIVSTATLLALAMLSLVGLKGLEAWLAFRRSELATGTSPAGTEPSTLSRIELADLKERLKKLEAIAAGVDL